MDHQAVSQLLGNYGEFVGAIGVVVTLAFLTIQVRHSRRALEDSMAQRETESVNQFSQSISEWSMSVFGDSELSALFLRGRSGESLDPKDAERFLEVASQFFVRNRSVYISAVASENEGQAAMTVIGTSHNISKYPGMKDVWDKRQRFLTNLVAPRFVAAVDSKIKELLPKQDP